jgi:hypothetical protein
MHPFIMRPEHKLLLIIPPILTRLAQCKLAMVTRRGRCGLRGPYRHAAATSRDIARRLCNLLLVGADSLVSVAESERFILNPLLLVLVS